MKRKLFFPILLIYVSGWLGGANAQGSSNTDSLKQVLQTELPDTVRLNVLHQIVLALQYSYPDSAMKYTLDGLELAENLDNEKYEILFKLRVGGISWTTGNYPNAIHVLLECLQQSEEIKDDELLCRSLNTLGLVYREQGSNEVAVKYYRRMLAIAHKRNREDLIALAYSNMGTAYLNLKQLDSALYFGQMAYHLFLKLKDDSHMGPNLTLLGNIQKDMGNTGLALEYFRLSVPWSMQISDMRKLSDTYISMAQVYQAKNMQDSCIYYARKALEAGQTHFYPKGVLGAAEILAHYYKSKSNIDSAYHYQQLAITTKDTLYDQEKIKQIQTATINEELRQQELEDIRAEEEKERKYNLQLLAIAVFIVSFIVFVLILSRRKISPSIIEFFGLLALLMVFEFVALLLHPFIEKITHHTPMWMLLALVIIAAVLVPMHHKLHHWISHELAGKKHPAAGEQESDDESDAPLL